MTAETLDYKDTLFLPRTDFPMRAGLPAREPDWLARWERLGIYHRLRATAHGRPPFVLHDGPPYANGHLHIGHALNKVLKDFVVRSRQMMGHDSRYVPGWDCHGLPIEWKIEEQYRARGKSKDAVPVNELRAECRRFAEHWVGVQREEFKRLGVTGDWENPYLTMDFHAEAVIADEFMKFVMNGSLYLGSKPVMWSPVEQTALAEAEIEYHDHQSPTIWVKFPVVGPAAGAERLPRWRAACRCDLDDDALDDPVQPGRRLQSARIAYGALSRSPTRPRTTGRSPETDCVLADKLARRGDEGRRASTPSRASSATPAPLAGVDAARIPCADLDALLGLRGARCSPATSSPTTPAPASCTWPRRHGADDYELFVKNGLVDRMTHNVLEDSSFAAHVPFFAGLQVFDAKGKEGKANKAVIDKLVEAGALLARGRLTHSYPHSWRSKAPVIYRNTPQWFVAIDRPLGDGIDEYGQHHPRAGADLDRPAGQLVPADRPQPALLDDRGPPRLGAVAPARLGRAADLLRQAPTRRHRRDPARPRRQRPDQGGLRDRGRRRLVRGERQGALPRQRPPARRVGEGHRHPRRLVRTPAPPTPSRCATGPTASGRPTSTSRAPTSTAAGSTPRCCRPAAPAAARPTRRC